MSENSTPVQALMTLGFTGLESEIYTALLRESPVTGYRVAQILGKPVANVYKAIESLENKGALLVSDGANRIYRPVPPAELLQKLEREFQQRQMVAERALKEIDITPEDDRVYEMRTADQVMERCRAMLASASKLIVLDAFPGVLEQLRPDLEAAARRGIQVVLKAFRPVSFPGMDVVLNPNGELLMEAYPGQLLILVVDGTELLIASLSDNGTEVQQAVWTGSAMLSWMFHTSFIAEIALCAAVNELQRGTSPEDVERFDQFRALLWPYLKLHDLTLPGYEALRRRFGRAMPDDWTNLLKK